MAEMPDIKKNKNKERKKKIKKPCHKRTNQNLPLRKPAVSGVGMMKAVDYGSIASRITDLQSNRCQSGSFHRTHLREQHNTDISWDHDLISLKIIACLLNEKDSVKH